MNIAVEGIDGSGKTTLVDYLIHALETYGTRGIKVDWFRNSPVKDLAEIFNKYEKMNPEVLACIHACETQRLMNAYEGKDFIKVWDRSIFSSYCHCVVRGGDLELMGQILNHYDCFDLIIFLKCNPEIAYDRISNSRKINFYESGLDRWFRNRANAMKLKYDSGEISKELTKASFIQTMTEWNNHILRILPKDRSIIFKYDSFDSLNSVIKEILERALKLNHPK